MGNKKQTKSKHIVSKSRFLNEASYKVNIGVQHLVLLAISKVNPMALEVPDKIKITVKDWEKLYKGDKKYIYRALKKAALDLYRSEIIEKNNEGIEAWSRWVSADQGIRAQKNEGYVEVSFSKKVKPHLSMIRGRFVDYQIRHIASLKKVSTIRLYELCQQWNKSSGIFITTFEPLKKALGLEDKYIDNWKGFNQRVIKPAIIEIGLKTDIEVEMHLKRKGRKIDKIIFSIIPKSQKELDL